ncbi:phosphatase PAP2 family protein [Azospirillum sp.]|uniref:phosphatase PAP2 family protein n=1 Tax=Azospirillum sp. TaxID=34012 RepID=UPI003D7229FD
MVPDRLKPHMRWERWLGLARREIWPLLAVLLVAGGLLAFGKLAEEVLEGDTGAFDRAVLLALRNPADLSDPIGPGWVEEMARDVTSLGSHAILTLITLAVIGYLMMVRKRAAALLVFASIGGGMLLSAVLKHVFERARPELVPHAVPVYTASFPSGHAMLSALTYLTLGALLIRVESSRRVKAYLIAVAIIVTFLVGGSRVYLGVHWPTDVLAGWCVGATWATLWWLVALWLQRRGDVEREGRKEPD